MSEKRFVVELGESGKLFRAAGINAVRLDLKSLRLLRTRFVILMSSRQAESLFLDMEKWAGLSPEEIDMVRNEVSAEPALSKDMGEVVAKFLQAQAPQDDRDGWAFVMCTCSQENKHGYFFKNNSRASRKIDSIEQAIAFLYDATRSNAMTVNTALSIVREIADCAICLTDEEVHKETVATIMDFGDLIAAIITNSLPRSGGEAKASSPKAEEPAPAPVPEEPKAE